MYVAIAGNIGSGKTTLTEILTKRYGAKAYYESTDNPYIGDFYNNMSRWAFQLQISFLGSRIRQTMDMLAAGEENAQSAMIPFTLEGKSNSLAINTVAAPMETPDSRIFTSLPKRSTT